MQTRLKKDVIECRRWPDGVVLFCRPSGDTIFLDSVAAAALPSLISGVRCAEDLGSCLERDFGLPGGSDAASYAALLLQRLRELDAVEEVVDEIG